MSLQALVYAGTVGQSFWRNCGGGETLREGPLPAPQNSTMLHIASGQHYPELKFSYTVSGQIYRCEGNGPIWRKLDREFGEIRTMVSV